MITHQIAQNEYFEQLLKEEHLKELPLYYTFCELLENCNKKFADCPAISDTVNTINYGELYDRIAHRRAFLYEEGYEKGDIIAVMAPNCLAAMELYMAIPTAGYTVIMLPAAENALTAEQLGRIIKKFDIKGMFVHSSFEELTKNQPVKLYKLEATSDKMADMAEVSPDDIAVICFSVNNDAGNPYGAMLSHKAIMRAAHNGLFIPGHPYNQRTIAILPLSHVFGAIRGLLTCIYTGALVYACEDMSNIVFDIPKMKPTILTLVPGLAETVLALAKIKGAEFLSGIETIICGGAFVQPKLIKQADSFGITLFAGYGMTEATGMISANVDNITKPDTIGKVYCGNEVRIVDGEIQVKGDTVMKGYYNDPERTAEVFTEDGWLKTGDLGEFDEDGYLHILGLRKNLIVLPNGENVSPEELEKFFLEVPEVKDCVVKEGDLRGRPLIAIEVLPNMDCYKGMEEAEIEKDIKAKIKARSSELPSYKGVSKTIVTFNPIDHTIEDRLFKVEW